MSSRCLTPEETESFRGRSKMTIDELLNKVKNKYLGAFSSKKITPAQQMISENEWTEDLLQFVHFGNTHVLKNFRYRLVMEDDGVNQGIDNS
jgi:hypothetical protein